MITLELITPPAYIVRVCPNAVDGEIQPKFTAVATLEIDGQDSSKATFKGMLGELSPADKRELLTKIYELGIVQLTATRKEGHKLPLARLKNGVYEVNVPELYNRLNRIP